MHTCSADIIIGTQTWLSDEIPNKHLTLPSNFEIFRKDRCGSRRGGVAIAVKEEYRPSQIDIDSPLEIIWVSIHIGHTPCVLGACYRPPDGPADFVDSLNDTIGTILHEFPSSLLVIGGDFNYPGIDWPTNSVTAQNNRLECLSFIQCIDYHQLTQIVCEPTRSAHLLDLILTNQPEITNTHVIDEISDHKAIHCTLSVARAIKTKTEKQIFNNGPADLQKMNDMLETLTVNLETGLQDRTMNENWCLFRDKLKEIQASCIPKTVISSRTNDPWFTRDVKRLLNRKKRAYRKSTRTNDPDDWQNYKQISTLTEQTIREAKHKYFNITLPSIMKTDPSKFWSIINPKNKNTVPVLTNATGDKLSLQECAEHFNKAFAKVFTTELPLNDSFDPSQPNIDSSFTPIVITAHGVACAIDHLAFKTSPGPDGITAKLLKITSPYSAYLLSLLFQQSLDSGCLPDDWKFAHTLPFFKSGDRSDPLNYRPISLTSISCKLLEHILFTHVVTHLNQNNFFISNQHGFRKHFSCQTQLFELVTDLHVSQHRLLCTDAIFVDLSKAFDRVPHQRLMAKICNLNLDDKTTHWIRSFLTDRLQSVKLNDHVSNPVGVSSGVPQWSVLGPLLFLIYINDLACNISSSIRLFADDCVIYREIVTSDDVSTLQHDLFTLTEWCEKWLMKINVEKTKHVQFSSTTRSETYNYLIDKAKIETV